MEENLNLICIKQILLSIITKQHFYFDRVYSIPQAMNYIIQSLTEIIQLSQLSINQLYKLYNISSQIDEVYKFNKQFLIDILHFLKQYKLDKSKQNAFQYTSFIISNLK